MKKFIYGIMLLPMLMLVGCEKEIMDYEGVEGVYFAAQWGDSWGSEKTWPYQPYTLVQFVSVKGNETTVSIPVMVTGPIKDYERSFGVEINPDSTTAVENVDYLPIEQTAVIPAGELKGKVDVTLLRTEKLQSQEIVLGLKLIPTTDLRLSFPEWDAVDGYTSGPITQHFDASLHSIRFDDRIVEPEVWVGTAVSPYNGGYESGSWGAFSRKKLELICERFDLTYNDFMSTETMPSVLQTLIAKVMSDILIERYNAKDPVLEDDGRLMWMGYCPWKSMVGVPWIPDEDYYN